jgi:hypothetical protein
VRRALLALPALLPALLLVLIAAGCGADDSSGSSSTAVDQQPTAPGAGDPASTDPASPSASDDPRNTGLVVSDGITPAELVDCLTGAGLRASTDEATMMGLDDDQRNVRVDDMEGFEGPGSQGANLYVFTDPASARESASAITLGGSDDASNNRFAVAGNVVRELDSIMSSTHTQDEDALLGCLPGAG